MDWKGSLAFMLAAAAMASPAAAQGRPAYTSLTVFGDSLVDAGNIRTLGFGADPEQGYFDGRFSNGYVYTDVLSTALFGRNSLASLRGGTNFAYGGARASATTLVPDLSEQITQYDAYRRGAAADATGLFVMNFGGNDVFATRGLSDPAATTLLTASAGAYAAGVQSLVDRGARTILLTGFVGTTPADQVRAGEAEGLLTTALAGVDLRGATLYRFSYLSLFDRFLADPASFGFTDPLILPDPTRPDGGTCQGARAWPACSGYFSFDGTHPTTAVHRIVFEDMNRQFQLTAGAAVPEPASWALMIAGIGAVGGAMRYRRRDVRVRFA